MLEEFDFLDRQVAEYESRIKESLAAYEDLVRRLCTIPTVDLITAWTLLAEIGTVHQLRVVNLARRVVQDRDEVVIAPVLKPRVLARVDVQQHAGDRPPWPAPAVRAAPLLLGHQAGFLQRLFHPCVTELYAVVLDQL